MNDTILARILAVSTSFLGGKRAGKRALCLGFYSTIFDGRITASKGNKFFGLSGFCGAVFDPENTGPGAKFIGNALLGRGDEGLGLVGEVFEQLSDAFVIELGVDIVDQKERIFAARGVKNGDIRKLQEQKGASLLTGRAKLPQIMR